jgi:hypothetical protein
MSGEEIWNDPARPKVEYLAEVIDPHDQSNLGNETFEAVTGNDAWPLAYQWALDLCRKAKKKGRLLVSGGDIHGTRSAEIDPFAP